jgi:hypothetical protein
MSPKAYAMAIAWEQVEYWRTHMSAGDVGEIIGLGTNNWASVAHRLADMWLALETPDREAA